MTVPDPDDVPPEAGNQLPDSPDFEAGLAGFGRSADRNHVAARDQLEQLASQLAEQLRRETRQVIHLSDDQILASDPAIVARFQQIAPVVQALENWKHSKAAEAGSGELPAALPVDRLGVFRLIREIGRGGNAIVFEAFSPHAREHVAVKVYPRRGSPTAPLRQRFLDEARSMSRLQHQHIVPVIEVAEDAGFPYYVMRLALGGSLDRLIDRLRHPDRPHPPHGRFRLPVTRRDDWTSLSQIAIQIARAIAFAHASGVLHGDVKPANVLLDAAGDVMVADFGPSMPPELSHSGKLTGTYRYMAPERFDGHCDERSDVYALGATLYELIALVPAFQADGEDSLIRSILRHELVAPRFIRSDVPPELNAVIVKAMSRAPQDRYAQVADLVADLLNFVRGQPISVEDDGRRTRWWRRFQRRR